MHSVTIRDITAVTPPAHWNLDSRRVFRDERVTVNYICIHADGGVEPHAHDFDSIHIFILIKGRLKVHCGGETVHYTAGQAFWFERGELHQVLPDGEEAEYILINAPSFPPAK